MCGQRRDLKRTRVILFFFLTLLFATSLRGCCSVSFLLEQLLHPVFLASMALDCSGLSNTTLLDTRHLASDLLRTPNTSQGQFFNRGSLLMDRMHDTYMTPDSSPMVCASTTICTLTSSVLLSRTYCPLPWSLGLVALRTNNCWRAGTLPIYRHNL